MYKGLCALLVYTSTQAVSQLEKLRVERLSGIERMLEGQREKMGLRARGYGVGQQGESSKYNYRGHSSSLRNH